MPKQARVTLTTVRRLALAFPGVEEGLSYGTPGFRVRGRFLARMWEDGETLVVKCGDIERDFRMKADPETFFVTDHYRGYPTVLVRLPGKGGGLARRPGGSVAAAGAETAREGVRSEVDRSVRETPCHFASGFSFRL